MTEWPSPAAAGEVIIWYFMSEGESLKSGNYLIFRFENGVLKILEIQSQEYLYIKIFDENLFKFSRNFKFCFYIDKPFQKLKVFIKDKDSPQFIKYFEYIDTFLESVNRLELIADNLIGIYHKKNRKFSVFRFDYENINISFVINIKL